MRQDSSGHWISADGRYTWDGRQWVQASSQEGTPRARIFGCFALPAVTSLVVGWSLSIAVGTTVSGALISVLSALAGCVGVSALLWRLLAGNAVLRSHAFDGAVLAFAATLIVAPILLVRPFAGVAGTVGGTQVATGGAVAWAVGAVAITFAVALTWMLIVWDALSRRFNGVSLIGQSVHALVRRDWRSAWVLLALVGCGVLLSVGSVGFTIATNRADHRAGEVASMAMLPNPVDVPLPLHACQGSTIPEYLAGNESLSVPGPAGRSFEESWSLMQANGVIEGSHELLVKDLAQCHLVVGSDPWIETFVFRFGNYDQALRMYKEGLLGIWPSQTIRPGERRDTKTPLGWEENLRAASDVYSNDGSRSAYVAFWPYSNYLVFFICSNVDAALHAPREIGVGYALLPCEQAAKAIQDRLHSAVGSP